MACLTASAPLAYRFALLLAGLSCGRLALEPGTAQAQNQAQHQGPQAAPAEAKSPEAETGQGGHSPYRRAIDRAVQEFALGHFREAQALFHHAHALRPNARTLRGLGVVAFELREYVQSIGYLEQALTATVQALPARLRRNTQTLLQRAREFVGSVTVNVDPPTAEVRVDLALVPPNVRQRLPLNLGAHTIEAHAPGFERQVVALDISMGGQHEELQLKLQSLVVADAPPSRSAPATTPVRTRSLALTTPYGPRDTPQGDNLWANPWLWAGVGAAVLGAGVAVVLVASQSQNETGATGGSTGTILMGF